MAWLCHEEKSEVEGIRSELCKAIIKLCILFAISKNFQIGFVLSAVGNWWDRNDDYLSIQQWGLN